MKEAVGRRGQDFAGEWIDGMVQFASAPEGREQPTVPRWVPTVVNLPLVLNDNGLSDPVVNAAAVVMEEVLEEAESALQHRLPVA
jgi:hypothetical protein